MDPTVEPVIQKRCGKNSADFEFGRKYPKVAKLSTTGEVKSHASYFPSMTNTQRRRRRRRAATGEKQLYKDFVGKEMPAHNISNGVSIYTSLVH